MQQIAEKRWPGSDLTVSRMRTPTGWLVMARHGGAVATAPVPDSRGRWAKHDAVELEYFDHRPGLYSVHGLKTPNGWAVVTASFGDRVGVAVTYVPGRSWAK